MGRFVTVTMPASTAGLVSRLPPRAHCSMPCNEITHPQFLSVTINHKEDLYQVLQKFLQPREAAHV